ncbi:unnamed protein product [Ixodes pacificus]
MQNTVKIDGVSLYILCRKQDLRSSRKLSEVFFIAILMQLFFSLLTAGGRMFACHYLVDETLSRISRNRGAYFKITRLHFIETHKEFFCVTISGATSMRRTCKKKYFIPENIVMFSLHIKLLRQPQHVFCTSATKSIKLLANKT